MRPILPKLHKRGESDPEEDVDPQPLQAYAGGCLPLSLRQTDERRNPDDVDRVKRDVAVIARTR